MVSTRQVKNRGNTIVDNRFNIPPGLVDVTHDPNQIGTTVSPLDTGDATQTDDSVQVIPLGGNTDTSNTFAYMPPTNVNLISQTVRILADGSHVVDVILEVTDNTGVSEYDVRVSKT